MLALVLTLSVLSAEDGGISQKQADDIVKELREIKGVLQSLGSPRNAQGSPPAGQVPPVILKLEDSPFMLGAKGAPLTIVEFTDYQCPFCQKFHLSVFNELKKDYIDTGLVRFYSRDFPLVEAHTNALRAAQAARCAAEQGKFWEVRDALQSNPQQLELANLLDVGRNQKLDTDRLQECIVSEKYRKIVEADMAVATRIGIGGTPAFVVGKSTPDGVDGQLIMGALPYSVFDQKLREIKSSITVSSR